MFSVFVPVAASSAQFVGKLRNKEATEGTTVTLRCELTKEAPVEWKKGTETLRNGDKYSLKQDGAVCELQICSLLVADAGEYSCVCGQEKTSATLTVKGKERAWLPSPHACVPTVHPTLLLESLYIYEPENTSICSWLPTLECWWVLSCCCVLSCSLSCSMSHSTFPHSVADLMLQSLSYPPSSACPLCQKAQEQGGHRRRHDHTAV